MLVVRCDGFGLGTAGGFDREEYPAVQTIDVRETCDPLSCGFCLVVPDLTRSADIKLNARVSLRRHRERVVIIYRTIFRRPDPAWQSRQAIIFRLAALLSR
jgi:hypothetical protein